MTVQLEVKACGIRSPVDVHALEEIALADPLAAVDFVGINLVSGSKRCVDLADAGAIVGACRIVMPVALMADVDSDTAARVGAALGVRWLQLHGAETPAMVAALSKRFSVIKALNPSQLADATLVAAFLEAGVKRLLLDGSRPGSGQRWALPDVRLVDGQLGGVPVWLAGGLHEGNVAAAASALGVAGVDAASGVERFGRFSVERAAAFAKAARTVAAPQPWVAYVDAEEVT